MNHLTQQELIDAIDVLKKLYISLLTVTWEPCTLIKMKILKIVLRLSEELKKLIDASLTDGAPQDVKKDIVIAKGYWPKMLTPMK